MSKPLLHKLDTSWVRFLGYFGQWARIGITCLFAFVVLLGRSALLSEWRALLSVQIDVARILWMLLHFFCVGILWFFCDRNQLRIEPVFAPYGNTVVCRIRVLCRQPAAQLGSVCLLGSSMLEPRLPMHVGVLGWRSCLVCWQCYARILGSA